MQMPKFHVGDSVRYAEGEIRPGKTDSGKVCEVTVIGYRYRVQWDDEDPSDTYEEHQLMSEPEFQDSWVLHETE